WVALPCSSPYTIVSAAPREPPRERSRAAFRSAHHTPTNLVKPTPMTPPLSVSLPATLSSSMVTWCRQVWTIARKDLMIELRSGEVVVTGGFFAVLVTVLSSLAYYMGPQTRNQVAAGVIWLATTFAAVLSLSRTWQRER